MTLWSRRRLLIAAALGGGAALSAATVALTRGSGGSLVLPGRSRSKPVRTVAVPPAQADVVIIGGGLIGVLTAFNLARQGVSVVLCEKGAIAGEASGRSQGQVASAGLEPWKLPLINLSKQLWSELNVAVEGETGYRRTGLVCPFVDQDEQHSWERWLRETAGAAPGARLCTAEEANRLVPAKNQKWRGAFCDPTDGAAEPVLAAPAVAEAAIRHGATMVAPCAVRGFETQAGRVSHVVTEKGTIRTGTVVLAGGCWSTLFAEHAKLRLPSLSIFTTQLHVGGFKGPECVAGLPGLDVRLQMDGTYTLGATIGRIALTPSVLRHLWDFRNVILHPPWDVYPNLSGYFFHELREPTSWRLDEPSPFERNRILEPTTNLELRRDLLARASAALPGFETARILETWSGALNVLPDNVPVISTVKAIPGLHIATGFSYGLTMGPAAGLLMAQVVMGVPPSVDLHPYRYERFVDGSRLVLTR